MPTLVLPQGSDVCRKCCEHIGIRHPTPRQLETASYVLVSDPVVQRRVIWASRNMMYRRLMSEVYQGLVHSCLPIWKTETLQNVLSYTLSAPEFRDIIETYLQRSVGDMEELWGLYLVLVLATSTGEDNRQLHDPYQFESSLPLFGEPVEAVHSRLTKKQRRVIEGAEYAGVEGYYTAARFHGGAQNEQDDPHPFFALTREDEPGYPDDDKVDAAHDSYWSNFIRGAESTGRFNNSSIRDIGKETPDNVITRIGDVFLVDANVCEFMTPRGLDMSTKVLHDEPSTKRAWNPQNPQEPFRHVESRRSHRYVDGRREGVMTFNRIHSEMLSRPMKASHDGEKLVYDPHGDHTMWLGDPRGLDALLHHMTHIPEMRVVTTKGWEAYHDGRVIAGPKYNTTDAVGGVYSFRFIRRFEGNKRWYTYLLIPVEQVTEFFAYVREDAKFLIARLNGGVEKQVRHLTS